MALVHPDRASSNDAALRRETVTLHTRLGPQQIAAEVATTDAARALGLMFRRSIGADEGMLFIYTPAQPVSMWMRNTYIPLDMVFIDASGTVSRTAEHTEPFSEELIPSGGNVAAVLELKAGTVERLGVKAGDRVEWAALAP